MSTAHPAAVIGEDDTPPATAKWAFVRRRGMAALQAFGFREVSPSPVEEAGLAARVGTAALSIGDGAELRGDAVASLVRLYGATGTVGRFARWMLSDRVFAPAPEAPLHARSWLALAGATFGASAPEADADLVLLAAHLSTDLNLSGPELRVGTVGDPDDIARFLAATTEARSLACARCQALAPTQPLAFLVCSDEGCRAIVAAVPRLRSFVGAAALEHHRALVGALEQSGCRFVDDEVLVATSADASRTVFELRAVPEAQGANDPAPAGAGAVVVAQGARRDALVERVTGRRGPLVGMAIDVRSAARCVPGPAEDYDAACEVFFASQGARARTRALKLAATERARGFRVDVELRDVGWKDQLERAEALRARVVVLLGPGDPVGELAVRNMKTRETEHVRDDALPAHLKRLLR
jgi:histidyl-tRNA synthetase